MGTRPRFQDLLEAQWAKGKHVCVGLDPTVDKLPEPHKLRYTEYSPTTPGSQFLFFCREIVHATADLACAYKPNLAFFEEYGEQGWKALRLIIKGIRAVAPDVPVIADGKRGGIGNTNVGYAKMAFDYPLAADAITVSPYMGGESLKPFLDRADKGVFVLCRTSNPGAGEFQDLQLGTRPQEFQSWDVTWRLYHQVAYDVQAHWNKHCNCGLVTGATYPDEIVQVRKIAPEIPLLIPGVGKQGGDLEASVRAAKSRFIINSSSGIIFASKGADFAARAREETEKLHNQIAVCLAATAS